MEITLTKQMVVGISLMFEGKTTIADMVQVLEPLEVGYRHTTSIHVQVLQDTHI